MISEGRGRSSWGKGSSRVILANDSPLALGNVGTPFLPVLGAVLVFPQALLLSADHVLLVNDDHVEDGLVGGTAGIGTVELKWADGGRMQGRMG